MDHAIEQNINGSTGHEHREASIQLVVVSAAALVVVVVFVMVLVWGIFNVLKKNQEAEQVSVSPLAPTFQAPPYPRIEDHPWEEIRRLHAREDNVLSTYGWQDQKAGIVRIPIDRAMDLMLQKGFPVLPNGSAPAAAKPAAPKPAGVPSAAK